VLGAFLSLHFQIITTSHSQFFFRDKKFAVAPLFHNPSQHAPGGVQCAGSVEIGGGNGSRPTLHL